MMTINKPKDVETAYRDFAGVFTSGAFTPEEQQAIVATSQRMKGRRLGATPHFQSYLESLMGAKRNATYATQLLEWNKVLDDMLRDEANFRSNGVADFLAFSKYFYTQQAIKYSPNSVSWFAFADKVAWAYDEQPVFTAENALLTAMRADDSLTIERTSFRYLPLANQLEGNGGQSNWARTSLGAAVTVDLEKYTIETLRSLYEAEVAYLTFPSYFGGKKIKGSFSDKLVSDDSRTSYPRFESADKAISIPNVGEGVRLRGGFRLHGSTVYAVGTKDNPAELLVLNALKQPRFLGTGNLVAVKDEGRIVGENVHSVLYLGADSLYHPSVNVRLNISDLSLELSRGKQGTNRHPFYHSLHNMNVEADFIKAYLREDSLIIGRPTASFVNKADVIFESLHFFNSTDYNRIQNIGEANPMAIMKATAEREKTRVMSAALLAKRINSRFTVESITPLIYDLVAKGFIDYEPERQEVTMKDKLFHYVNAEAGNVDYDYLKLTSESDTLNATIDLKTGHTLLNAVKRIEFSKAQKVAVLPAGNQAYLKGNRNFDFDGRLFAGYGVFEGKDFKFKYEEFQVNLDSVRYFDLYVPTGDLDEKQQPVALSIGSRIEHLSGVLLIDAPNNKSGRKDIFMFPSFQSKGKSYVYYDAASEKNKVYTRDSFHFELQPFSFDHLDVFGAQDVTFKGKLKSHNIFPDIAETLKLREDDKSLGFSHKTPAEGYPAYGGKGQYTGDIELSNNGLGGKGRLNYLQAVVNADDFLFMPKQTTGSAEAFDLKEDRLGAVPVPEVHGEAVNIEWRPYSDSLIVRSQEAPFELFRADDHQLKGSLVLTPSGLQGTGDLLWSLAEARSNAFSFGPNDAKADTMGIKIKALEIDDRLALETNNVNGTLDFDKQKGHFEANDEAVITTLPYNQYVTAINKFDWDMKGSTIEFESEKGKKSAFTSIHPNQDSLSFLADRATYDLNTSLLHIMGVEKIMTSDAFVYPDSTYVEIAPNAQMTTLQNARIVADTLNKYHVINRATVNIEGHRVYKASGYYEYNVGPHKQEFELENIAGQPIGKGSYQEKQTVTRATGEIEPTDTFYIDHKTQYRGTISLSAENRALKFDGFARFTTENLPNPYWFTVSFEGDKNNLVINYDVPKSYDNEPLFSGLFLSKEFGRVYPRIIAPLLFRKDRPLLDLSKGVIRYVSDKDQLVLGDSSIVLRNDLVGNQMIFNNSDRKVAAEGKFTLGSGLKYVSVDAAGRLATKFPLPLPEEVAEEEPAADQSNIMLVDEPETPDSTAVQPEVEEIAVTTEWMMGMSMRIPDELLKIVYNDFQSASFEARPISYLMDVAFYQKTVREIFPDGKERRDALDGLALGFLDIPKRVNPYSFLFSKLNMKWHNDYQSFVSVNKNNGLVSINGEPLNKEVECYVELKMTGAEDDDRLYIYLKSPSGLTYFFGYKQGILSITSNNTVFMQQLEGIKEKDRIFKMPDGQTFEIQPVELGSSNLFLRRIQAVQ